VRFGSAQVSETEGERNRERERDRDSKIHQELPEISQGQPLVLKVYKSRD